MIWRRLLPPGVSVSPAVFRELVGLLYTTTLPMALVGIAATAVGMLIANQTSDLGIAILAGLALLITFARLAINIAYHRHGPPPQRARLWERRYGIGSFVFAAIIGLLGARTLQLDDPVAHMLATGLLFSYTAGVVNRVAVRPLICLGSVALATGPFVAVTIGRWELAYVAHGAFLLLMLLASIETVRHTYRTTVEQITTKRRYEQLARVDPLTRLPNRLLLEEDLQDAIQVAIGDNMLVAVHFLDLDRFKEVNDRFGHLVGDALLIEVARRLKSILRQNDRVARLGGDEFVVVQCRIALVSEAEMLARRMIRALSARYRVGNSDIDIGVSIGVALAPSHGIEPQQLLAVADAALYEAKRRGRGGVVFSDSTTPPALRGNADGKHNLNAIVPN